MRIHASIWLVCLGVMVAFPPPSAAQWSKAGDPGGGWITCLAPIGENLFAATRKGGVFLSTDNGVTWKAVNSGLPPRTDFQCLAAAGTALFAGSVEHGAYLSVDNGATWKEASSGLPEKASVWRLAVSGTTLFAVAGPEMSTVYRSADNGASWVPANSGLGDVQVMDIAAVGPNLFAGTAAGVFRSSDEGASWTRVAEISPCLRLATLDKKIFAGSYAAGRVSWSSQDGAEWEDLSAGLPDPADFSLSDLAAHGPYLFLASFQGVFMISAAGQMWANLSAGLPDQPSIYSLAANETYLFAGTEQGQVWRLPLSDLSLALNLSDPALSDEMWERLRTKSPRAVIIPDVIKAALQAGLASRQGRRDIPFTIFKTLALPSKDFFDLLLAYDSSRTAAVLLPQRLYDAGDWRRAVLFFKVKNADLGFAPVPPERAKDEGLPEGAHVHRATVKIFLEFRQTDISGASRVVREVFVPGSFELESATYDPGQEHWYTVGHNLRPGKYTLAMAIAAPEGPGSGKGEGKDLARIGVAYADFELAGPESFRTSLETTSIFFIKGMTKIGSDEFPVSILTASKGRFSWSNSGVVPFMENVVPPGSRLESEFDVFGAKPKVVPAQGSKYDLEIASEVRREGGPAVILWAPEHSTSTSVKTSLPLVEHILVKEEQGERWERRNLGPGKYTLAIGIKDNVTGLTAEKRVPFEVGSPQATLGEWVQVGTPGGGGIISLAAKGDILLATTKAGGIFTSSDDGDSWRVANAGLPANARCLCLAVSESDLFVATAEHGVFISTDNGESWKTAGPGLPAGAGVNCLASSGKRLFAGTAEGVFLSTDHGAGWTAVDAGWPKGARARCLALRGTDLLAGTDDGGVYLFVDAGAHWTPAGKGLPRDVNIYCLAASGGNALAGTEMHRLLLYPSAGQRWTAVEGIPGTEIHCFAASGSTLFAGTGGGLDALVSKDGIIRIPHGAGVLVSTDAGVSWQEMNSGLRPVPDSPVLKGRVGFWVESLVVGGANLYAGTESGEVWRLALPDRLRGGTAILPSGRIAFALPGMADPEAGGVADELLGLFEMIHAEAATGARGGPGGGFCLTAGPLDQARHSSAIGLLESTRS